jgi:hypothetical protein
MVREKYIVIHQPPTARGAINKDRHQERTDTGQDHREGCADDFEIRQQQDGREKADQREPEVERHRPEVESFVTFPLDLKFAGGAGLINAKERGGDEQSSRAAVRAAIGEPAQDNLEPAYFHQKDCLSIGIAERPRCSPPAARDASFSITSTVTKSSKYLSSRAPFKPMPKKRHPPRRR